MRWSRMAPVRPDGAGWIPAAGGCIPVRTRHSLHFATTARGFGLSSDSCVRWSRMALVRPDSAGRIPAAGGCIPGRVRHSLNFATTARSSTRRTPCGRRSRGSGRRITPGRGRTSCASRDGEMHSGASWRNVPTRGRTVRRESSQCSSEAIPTRVRTCACPVYPKPMIPRVPASAARSTGLCNAFVVWHSEPSGKQPGTSAATSSIGSCRIDW